MSDSTPRRKRGVLSPETKWEIVLDVTSGEISQADAARKWRVGKGIGAHGAARVTS